MLEPQRKLRLPPAGVLRPTSSVDAVAQYHGLGFGWVLRQRLLWARNALPQRRMARLLEIGYGSGIFMYELSAYADEVYGIDVHPAAGDVRRCLAADGVHANLTQASGMTLPFRDGSFDGVVIVSALEFMDDPLSCLREALRVVRPRGRVVCITPRVVPWADRLYTLLVGFDPESDFQHGRERVQDALTDLRLRAERVPKPDWMPATLAPYELVALDAPPAVERRADPTRRKQKQPRWARRPRAPILQ
jgi:SAM-dependent methyltransferase